MPAAGEDGKFAVFGALAYATGRLVWQIVERKDGAACVAFLDRLLAAFPDGPTVVVLDTVGDHKGRVAKRWWMDHRDRVRPLWLPADAPELNLIERVGRHLKDKLSCHRWWADLDALEAATTSSVLPPGTVPPAGPGRHHPSPQLLGICLARQHR